MIATIVIGFVIGVIAKWFMPGNDVKGFIMTTILGIAGSAVGAFLFGGRGGGIIGPVIGAILILWLYRTFAKK